MNATASTFFNVINWTVKISGTISIIILGAIAILILGVILEKVEPNGSTLEWMAQNILSNLWISGPMFVLSVWAAVLFWRKK